MTKATKQKKKTKPNKTQVTDQKIFNVVQMHLQALAVLTKVSQERLKINLGDTRDRIL